MSIQRGKVSAVEHVVSATGYRLMALPPNVCYSHAKIYGHCKPVNQMWMLLTCNVLTVELINFLVLSVGFLLRPSALKAFDSRYTL